MHTAKRPFSAVLASLLLIALASAPAFAGDKVKARRLYEDGQADYKAGRFLEAAHKFEQAHEELPRYQFLWNIGQAYRQQYEVSRDLATLRRALDVFRAFTGEAQTEGDRRDGRQAESEARQAVAEAERLDDARRAQAQAVAGSPVDVARARRRALVPALALIGGGVLIASTGAVLGGLARSEADAVQSASTVGAPVQFAGVADHQSRGQAYSIASYTLYGVGGAAAVAGVVMAVVGRGGNAAREQRAWIVPSVGGVVAGGSF